MGLNAFLNQKSSQPQLPAPTMGFKLNLPKPSFKIDWKGQVVPVTSAPGDGSGVDPYNLGIAQLQGPLDQATADAGDRQNAYDQSKADLLAQLTAQRDAPPEQNPGDILQPKEAGIAALATALAALGGARLPYIQAGLQGYVGGKKTLADMKYSNKYRAWQTAMQDIDRLTQAKQFDYTSKANELNQAESKRLGLIGQMTGLRKEQIAAQKEKDKQAAMTDRSLKTANLRNQWHDPQYRYDIGLQLYGGDHDQAVRFATADAEKSLGMAEQSRAMAGWLGARPAIEQSKLEDQQARTKIMRDSADSLAAHRLWQQQHPNAKYLESPYLKDLKKRASDLHQAIWDIQAEQNMSDDQHANAMQFNPLTGPEFNSGKMERDAQLRAAQEQLTQIENEIGQQPFTPQDASSPSNPNNQLPGVGGDYNPSGLTGPIQPMAATPPSQRKGGGAPLVASKALGGGAKKKAATPLAPKKKAPGSNVAKGKSGATLKW